MVGTCQYFAHNQGPPPPPDLVKTVSTNRAPRPHPNLKEELEEEALEGAPVVSAGGVWETETPVSSQQRKPFLKGVSGLRAVLKARHHQETVGSLNPVNRTGI